MLHAGGAPAFLCRGPRPCAAPSCLPRPARRSTCPRPTARCRSPRNRVRACSTASRIWKPGGSAARHGRRPCPWRGRNACSAPRKAGSGARCPVLRLARPQLETISFSFTPTKKRPASFIDSGRFIIVIICSYCIAFLSYKYR